MTTTTITPTAAAVIEALTAFTEHHRRLTAAGIEAAEAGDGITADRLLSAVEVDTRVIADALRSRFGLADGFGGISDAVAMLERALDPAVADLAELVDERTGGSDD